MTEGDVTGEDMTAPALLSRMGSAWCPKAQQFVRVLLGKGGGGEVVQSAVRLRCYSVIPLDRTLNTVGSDNAEFFSRILSHPPPHPTLPHPHRIAAPQSAVRIAPDRHALRYRSHMEMNTWLKKLAFIPMVFGVFVCTNGDVEVSSMFNYGDYYGQIVGLHFDIVSLIFLSLCPNFQYHRYFVIVKKICSDYVTGTPSAVLLKSEH